MGKKRKRRNRPLHHHHINPSIHPVILNLLRKNKNYLLMKNMFKEKKSRKPKKLRERKKRRKTKNEKKIEEKIERRGERRKENKKKRLGKKEKKRGRKGKKKRKGRQKKRQRIKPQALPLEDGGLQLQRRKQLLLLQSGEQKQQHLQTMFLKGNRGKNPLLLLNQLYHV